MSEFFLRKFVFLKKTSVQMENGNKKPVIAIDGVSGSGKSTILNIMAEKLGLQFKLMINEQSLI